MAVWSKALLFTKINFKNKYFPKMFQFFEISPRISVACGRLLAQLGQLEIRCSHDVLYAAVLL